MHISVLLNETIKYLNLKEDSIIIDCTLGYAGHSSEILKKIPKGYLYAFEQDIDAIKYSEKKLKKISSNFKIINKNFKEIDSLNPIKVDGILFDLGVSSVQLDNSDRGFSYHKEARLDMRMNQNNILDAYKVVNEYSEDELVNIFYKYGQEKYSKIIAHAIVNYRTTNKIETTTQLAEIIKENVPEKYRKKSHPARKIFQSIRIEVNDELNVFEEALKKALNMLNKNGRICVITFHSLEDKICKKIFKEVCVIPNELRQLPVLPEEYKPKYKQIIHIKPSKEEIDSNRRSRSAHLRVIEKL